MVTTTSFGSKYADYDSYNEAEKMSGIPTIIRSLTVSGTWKEKSSLFQTDDRMSTITMYGGFAQGDTFGQYIAGHINGTDFKE